MIIDYRKNAAHATRHSIFDADTGRKLDADFPIIFADDQAGLILAYRRDANGAFVLDHTGGAFVVDEIRRAINIVPKR